MRRPWFAFSIIIALVGLFTPVTAGAQQTTRVPRIGVLASSTTAGPHMLEAFRAGLRELGYVEGRSFVIEFRQAEGKLERLPALAAELAALRVDVIVVAGPIQARAAKQATRTIPIVFATAGDPVGSELVTSLARPGGNLTGLSSITPELVGKRLDLLKQALPTVSRVGVLWVPDGIGERTQKSMMQEAEAAARRLGVRLHVVQAQGPADLERAFSNMTRARVGALTVLPHVMFLIERKRLVDLAAQSRLPTVYPLRDFVDAGGLMAYGADDADLFRRAATYVDKILKGAKPEDLPVEQASKFELVINVKTAKALGLTIPPSVLGRADQVIEK
jgi:putative ABC transport system substrate-binding protein